MGQKKKNVNFVGRSQKKSQIPSRACLKKSWNLAIDQEILQMLPFHCQYFCNIGI